MTIRARLLSAVTGLTVVTLGGAFLAVSVAVNRDEERQLDRALVTEAREEAREIAQLGGDRLAISDRPGPTANDVGPLTKYAVIYGANGDPRASTPTFPTPPPMPDRAAHREARPFDLDGPGEHLRGVLVSVPGRRSVTLLLAAPRTNLDRDKAFLRKAMVLVFVVAVGWSLAIASWFLRRLTRDYELLAGVAHRAAVGDLTARVSMQSTDRDVAQLSRDIDGMIVRLETLVNVQRRFIANAAHELRSPLTALLGEVTLTLRRERSADEYRAALEEALDSAARLKEMADELLELARLGANTEAPIEPVPLDEVAASAVDELAVEAHSRGVEFVLEGAQALVLGRNLELQRCVRNLSENAARHARSRVRLRIETTEELAKLTVEDDGPGVRVEEADRIFEPFFRGPRASRTAQPGAGLGLAIAREIARGHRGEVRLEPVAGQESSSRFVLELPRATE